MLHLGSCWLSFNTLMRHLSEGESDTEPTSVMLFLLRLASVALVKLSWILLSIKLVANLSYLSKLHTHKPETT